MLTDRRLQEILLTFTSSTRSILRRQGYRKLPNFLAAFAASRPSRNWRIISTYGSREWKLLYT